MLLAEVMRDHRGALLASFRTAYQLPIVGHGLTLTEFADLVAWLPAGSQLWKSVGGPAAWSDEAHMLSRVEYQLRVLDWRKTKAGQEGRNAPKPLPTPPYAHEKRVEDEVTESRAEAWRRRQNRS